MEIVLPKKNCCSLLTRQALPLTIFSFFWIRIQKKRALEYYSELSARRNELLEKYAKFYGPLTIDTGNDSNLKSWQWMEQPFPWEQEGGCR